MLAASASAINLIPTKKIAKELSQVVTFEKNGEIGNFINKQDEQCSNPLADR